MVDYSNQSLPLEEITDIALQMSSGEGPFPHSDLEEKERDVIHSNRVKLTDYIHEPTVLFPYMKESDVFSVFDCEIIKGEPALYVRVIPVTKYEFKIPALFSTIFTDAGETVPHNRVDKFIDVLLTKGPKAIGVFHEALGKTYPGLFDYFTRLFTSKGIDLPESRRSKSNSWIIYASVQQLSNNIVNHMNVFWVGSSDLCSELPLIQPR